MTSGPADKPKHAPSPRHTLEEVLHSLHDLLRNELQTAGDKPAPTAAAAAAAQPPTPADVIAQLQGSLEALAPYDSKTETSTTGAGQAIRPGGRTVTHGRPDHKSADGTLQRQLPFADPSAPSPTPAAKTADQTTPDDFVLTPFGDTGNSRTDGNTADLEPETARPRREEPQWDDIPVLQNVVDPGPKAASRKKKATRPGKPPRSPGSTAATIDTHRVAVLVAARLDLELRRLGALPMDTGAVTRLAQILDEVLAQAVANMDNTFRN